jgi:hypothetical protein
LSRELARAFIAGGFFEARQSANRFRDSSSETLLAAEGERQPR